MVATCDANGLRQRGTPLHQLRVFAAADAVRAKPALKPDQSTQVFA
jgi:hypothetical protein